MKKRKAYAIIACILACILISGCGSKEKEAKWQDGYYTAIMGDYSHGWKEFVDRKSVV